MIPYETTWNVERPATEGEVAAAPGPTTTVAAASEVRPWMFPLPAWTVFVLLYLLGLVIPFIHIQSRPVGDYNWEAYTVAGFLDFQRDPTTNVFHINEGLMTNSGQSAVVVGPMWVTTQVFGESFGSFRLATVLIAGLAIPLTWLLGRRLASDAVGLGAAGLVATSQVYLLYGRTATNVGMSLTPALIGFILLWMCVRPEKTRWWIWLPLLQLSLIANSLFYSPIRFLWPIATGLFLVEVLFRSGQRLRFLLCFALTLVVLPLALGELMTGPRIGPRTALERYYNGRGEQIFRMNDDQSAILPFLPADSDEARAKLEEESIGELTFRLIEKNAKNLGRLLIDKDTKPAITDYWNPKGRLYPKQLVPLFALAMLTCLISIFRQPRSRYLLALFWGYSLPLLLTTNVHIGRLIYVVPLLAILVVWPLDVGLRWLLQHSPLRNRPRFIAVAPLPLCLAAAVLGAVPNLHDWFDTPFHLERAGVVANGMRSVMHDPPTQQLAYVFGDDGGWEVEQLRTSVIQVEMAGSIRMIDATNGETFGDGPVPVLFHGMLTRLETPASVPGYCTNLYLLEPNTEEQFLQVTGADAQRICGKPLTYKVV